MLEIWNRGEAEYSHGISVVKQEDLDDQIVSMI